MCNIAGYAGEKRAAPILIEMMKRQEFYDGGMSTGIATIHEGKLYFRKVLGDVETLLRETDALNLPGRVGIIHSRPGGDHLPFAHPHISESGRVASVHNGGSHVAAEERKRRNEICSDMLARGYKFSSDVYWEEEAITYPRLSDGRTVAVGEAFANFFEDRVAGGLSHEEAMSLATETFYMDLVSVLITADAPDRIYAQRVSTPMNCAIGEGETYIATTRFAFPEALREKSISLPLENVCVIGKGSLQITDIRHKGEKVSEITPKVFSEAYRQISALLSRGKENPVTYPEIEVYITKNFEDIWPEPHSCTQRAQLGYEILYQLHREGRLHSETRVTPKGDNQRVYMYIDN